MDRPSLDSSALTGRTWEPLKGTFIGIDALPWMMTSRRATVQVSIAALDGEVPDRDFEHIGQST
jgi:hypothetical protein